MSPTDAHENEPNGAVPEQEKRPWKAPTLNQLGLENTLGVKGSPFDEYPSTSSPS